MRRAHRDLHRGPARLSQDHDASVSLQEPPAALQVPGGGVRDRRFAQGPDEAANTARCFRSAGAGRPRHGAPPRAVPFGPKAPTALDRYRRAGSRRRRASEPALWLGIQGGLGTSAITQILPGRSTQSGIEELYCHRLRHVSLPVLPRAACRETP